MAFLNWKNKKIAIVGFGVEGIALAQFLREEGVKDFAILDKSGLPQLKEKLDDKAELAEEFLNDEKIEKRLGKGYLDKIKDYNLIFRSPGLSINNEKIQEAKSAGSEISSQIKLFFELCPCPIIGVTGTKGKGTTSSLIFEILKKEFEIKNGKSEEQRNVYIAGNIGYPAITFVKELKPCDVVILELSSFQLMDLHRSPHIAVVTNLTVDHLDYHKDISEYQDAKKSILRHQGADDFAILNADSTFNAQFVNYLKANVQFFSSTLDNVEAKVADGKLILDPMGKKELICKEEELKIFGKHNLENIAAATLAVQTLGIDSNLIKGVVKEFRGLPHRIELISEINGVRYINDSFATNPGPTMAAIDAFSEDKILILGGSSKGADFSELAGKITSANVKAVYLIGLEGPKIERELKLTDYKGVLKNQLNNLKDLLADIKIEAKSGDVVLFSPACASFDMFKNYKDRGEKFKTEVLNLS